ncbi:sirohydrochlorin cobaltochelatase [Clostridium carnis]
MSKAIIMVSFGTTNLNALRELDKIEEEVRNTFNNKYLVVRAFTSKVIVNLLNSKHGISIPRIDEVLFNLVNDGFEEVYIQPIHVIEGTEYIGLEQSVNEYYYSFKKVRFLKTLLGYIGEELNEACNRLVDAMESELPKDKNIVLVGHGSKTINTESYNILEKKFRERGYSNLVIGTLEGMQKKEEVLKHIKKENIDEVLLMPLLILSGNHVQRDLGGEEKSWKKFFEENDIKVELNLKSLLEYEKVREIYINQIKNVVS